MLESDRKMISGQKGHKQLDADVISQSAKSSNHGLSSSKHQQKHLSVGQLIKSIVYAGLDGTVNSLVIILTSIAAKATPYEVLTFCIAAVVGDGFSMGLGDYLSAKAQVEFTKGEQKRQHYEVEHFLEDQKKQIVDLYMEKGYTHDDSAKLADLYSTNTQAFVNIMMMEELGLVVGDESMAAKCGIASFIAYNIMGFLPGIPYVISVLNNSKEHPIVPVLIIGSILLFSLGYAKAKVIGIDAWKSGLEILVIGTLITIIGYTIGHYME